MKRPIYVLLAALWCAACVEETPPPLDTPAAATVRCEVPAADAVRGDAIDHADVPVASARAGDPCADARALVAVTAHVDALLELTEMDEEVSDVAQ